MRIKPSIVYAAFWIIVAPAVAFGFDMGAEPAPITGGALGTSAARPGTNSLGTALPDQVRRKSGRGGMKGVTIGTSPAIARQNKKVQSEVEHSVCRGC
jgi:hypothetical protein